MDAPVAHAQLHVRSPRLELGNPFSALQLLLRRIPLAAEPLDRVLEPAGPVVFGMSSVDPVLKPR